MGNRKEAKEKGLKTYFSDKLCTKCNSPEKYVSNYSCVGCTIESGLQKLNDSVMMEKYRTPEKTLNRVKRWRENNYDKFQKQWLKDKPANNARQANRRSLKRNQTPDDADFEIIKQIYYQCKQISEESGIDHEVDHIIPISKGGLHHQDNLQIITKSENRSKGNKLS